jgi:hypothetical protein
MNDVPPCDLLLFVTTQSEVEALTKVSEEMRIPMRKEDSRLGEYFDLGSVGADRVLAVKTRMGARIFSRRYRDHLVANVPPTKEPIIGGEMEGVGLVAVCAADKPIWCVVKAISDFADETRDGMIETTRATACENAIRFVLATLKSAHGTVRGRDVRSQRLLPERGDRVVRRRAPPALAQSAHAAGQRRRAAHGREGA